MKVPFPAILLTTSFAAVASLHADLPNPNKSSPANVASSTKTPVHIVVRSEADLKQTFTYFPRPMLSTEHDSFRVTGAGIYRLTVDRRGNVTEIKILKKMGVSGDSRSDVTALKTLITWRAKPGTDRIIDVTWVISAIRPFIINEGSHIPRH
jgi:hypothetical protein